MPIVSRVYAFIEAGPELKELLDTGLRSAGLARHPLVALLQGVEEGAAGRGLTALCLDGLFGVGVGHSQGRQCRLGDIDRGGGGVPGSGRLSEDGELLGAARV